MIKTTRTKTTQVAETKVYDLSNQCDGSRQVFQLPVAVNNQSTHYLIFNTTVYRNDANHTFYKIEDNVLTTMLTKAPRGGSDHSLQLVVNGDSEGTSGFVTKEEMEEAIAKAVNKLKKEIK